MKAFIYFIVNKNTNKRYIGQTTNYSRRKREQGERIGAQKFEEWNLQSYSSIKISRKY